MNEVATKGPVQRFFGVVSEVKESGAYAFISQVIDPYGQALDANGDVYLSKQDADGPLAADLRFEFEIEPDPRRQGKFKAMRAKITRNLPVLAATQQQLAVLGVRTGYHDRAKSISPAEVQKAVNNKPFNDALNAALENTVHLATEEDVDAFIRAYLIQSFKGLESLGLALDMRTAGETQERQTVENCVADLSEQGMAAQAASLTTMYELYVASCVMLRECRTRGVPAAGMHMSMGMMQLLLGGIDTQMRSNGERLAMNRIKEQADKSVETIRFLRDNDLLRPGCIIPMRNIVDVLVAAPIWYVASQAGIDENAWSSSDPTPDAAVAYFASLLGENQVWANFFQMWNRRTRSLARYEGDQIPPHILGAIKRARKHFDFVVIATPYHDVAGREWEDPAWQRSIDPFLYGFKKGLPYIYFLGRWSDSGLFPLMVEMMADTVAYLRANLQRLDGFGDNPYWHFAEKDHPDCGGGNNQHCFRGEQHHTAKFALKNLARQLVQAFDEGNLLDVLRKEKPLPTAR